MHLMLPHVFIPDLSSIPMISWKLFLLHTLISISWASALVNVLLICCFIYCNYLALPTIFFRCKLHNLLLQLILSYCITELVLTLFQSSWTTRNTCCLSENYLSNVRNFADEIDFSQYISNRSNRLRLIAPQCKICLWSIHL